METSNKLTIIVNDSISELEDVHESTKGDILGRSPQVINHVTEYDGTQIVKLGLHLKT